MWIRAGKARRDSRGNVTRSLRNDISARPEKGVSVFRFEAGRLVDNTPGHELIRQARWYLAEGRDWFVVDGTFIGHGSDGEPLLSVKDYDEVAYFDPDRLGLTPSWDDDWDGYED